MPYLLLIVEPEGQRAERGLEGGKLAYQAMVDYTAELGRAGVLVASNSLRLAATRLTARDGKPRWLDGPFAEARELVGGFFLLDGVTREQAMAWAERCPAARFASVELREVGPCYE